MNPNDPELLAAIAKSIYRVRNGGNPNRTVVRWVGTECESRPFPAWHDCIEEAREAIYTFFSYENRIRAIENREAERLADASEA